jgi:hypothetical protein
MSDLTWDTDNLEECRQARRAYQRMRDKGYPAFQNDLPVETFDVRIGHVRFDRALTRYDLLTEDDHGDDRFDQKG